MDFCCQSWWQSRLCNKYTIHSLNRCSLSLFLSLIFLSASRLSFFLILSLSFTHILSFSHSLILPFSLTPYVLFFYFYFSSLNCVDLNRVIIGLLKNSSCRLFTLPRLRFFSFLYFLYQFIFRILTSIRSFSLSFYLSLVIKSWCTKIN